MVLGFNESFIPAIVAGTKIHTIRAGRRWQAGAVAQFCARAQQPDCYAFWGPRPIVAVQAVVLTATALRIDGRPLGPAGQLARARPDGLHRHDGPGAFFAD